ncbi:aminoacyl-tRNA hydrolase [Desulfotomaculum copahuensis]|uniref:Peptidyl-tRNA hydrolase n=1 Tax=Desulfotomaculum copahuensis TaxID=1838280 RepID=A0A1B7LGD6_9FIRM|nr:aminoacyl-tRNA hydrolase [Desulfotomaculum copahuensis]OAT85099.1 aminoacyl-tRNA hydrolase [Desulfotomaculum copahuensis]
MMLVVGLGNPGPEYAASRHNVGFMVIDRLAARLGVAVDRRLQRSLVGQAAAAGEKIILAKPQTYMNASGVAVAGLLRWYRLEPAALLVISDDLDLPAGRLRLRRAGGHGGHNGLRSIIEQTGSRDFARLRIGIGRPADGRMDARDWVLGKFSPAGRELIEPVLDDAAGAVLTIAGEGLDAAMNRYNSLRGG